MNDTVLKGNIKGIGKGAVLIRNGHIAAAGSAEYILSAADAPAATDYGDAFIMPSFIDAHSHLSGYAASFQHPDLSSAANREEVKKLLLPHTGSALINAAGLAIKAEEPGFPDRDWLDREFAGIPVLISFSSGHGAVLSSAAEKYLGGQTENGIVREAAYFELMRKIPLPGKAEMMRAYELAQKSYASYGITTVQEGMMTKEMLPLIIGEAVEDGLFLDVCGYAEADAYEDYKKSLNSLGHPQKRLKLKGIKIFLDGSPQDKTAYMKEPYQDGSNGAPAMTEAGVTEAVLYAWRMRTGIAAHCNGDAACEMFTESCAQAKRRGADLRRMRPVMIHAQFADTKTLEKASKLGIIPSFFVSHIKYFGETHKANLGLSRASRMSPTATAGRLGIRYTLHTDTPVIPPDMLDTVANAVLRQTAAGETLGADERISADEALAAVTENAAYQYGEEKEKGRLDAGMLADISVLSGDPREANADEIRKIRVLAVYKEGKKIF